MTARNVPPAVPMDLTAGRAGRDAGMAQVLLADADQYKAAYRSEFLHLLASGRTFCSDDITSVVGNPPADCHPNVIGAVFNACLREFRDLVEPAGITQMKRPGAHARRTLLYRQIP